jgi:PAS domain S-box-containing protein
MTEMTQISEQQLLHALLDGSPDYIFFKDRQSHFIVTNDAHARLLLGLKGAQEAVGKTDFDLFTREEAQRFFNEEQHIMATGEPVIAREWVLHSSTTDQEVWLSEHKLPMRDEAGQVIGLLGISRNVTQLRQSEAAQKRLLAELEQRNIQLQAAADVSIVANSILDLGELVQKVIELIRERFNLYYVGVFLVDQTSGMYHDGVHHEAGEWANLQAGTGEAGKLMVQQRHRLKVGSHSMIGQCIASHKAHIALDVGAEAVRFENPLLPETHSELALPLVARGDAIGALTIQSSQKAAFTEGDIAVFQTVANQLTNAIENARLFKETARALQELKALDRSNIQRTWGDYIKTGKR